ncbi:hypothetical protein ACHAWF_011459 [Thalassiosira exigua]
MPLATAIIVAAAAYSAQQKGCGESSDGGGGGGEGGSSGPPEDIRPDFLEHKASVQLLPLEQSLTMLEWPITTVTFFRCDGQGVGGGAGRDAAIAGFERRTRAVLRANPFLGGWLVRGKGVGSLDRATRLWYDPEGGRAPPRYVPNSPPRGPPDRPRRAYEDAILARGAAVPHNDDLVNRKDGALWRIGIVPSPDGDEFALIASMSHVLGDGHTYYRIYNMLAGCAPIVALNPQRDLMFGHKVAEIMGRQEAHYVHRVSSEPAWLNLFGMGGGAGDSGEEDRASDLCGRVFLANPHWIVNEKAKTASRGNVRDLRYSALRSPMQPLGNSEVRRWEHPEHDSTNDVLVSWFWTLVAPDAGLMTVNFRGRIEGVDDARAGNYAHPVPYARGDYESPKLIRASLGECRRAGTDPATGEGSTTLPRPRAGLTFGVATNWSSFRPGEGSGEGETDEGEDDGAGAELVRHLPVVFPRRLTRTMPRRMSFLVIFSAGGGEVGCALVAPRRVMEEIDRCGVVGEKVAEF